MPFSIVPDASLVSRAWFVLLAAAGTMGCSNSSSSNAIYSCPGGGTSCFAIEQIVSAGGTPWTPASGRCVEVGDDPMHTLAIVLRTDANGEISVGTAGAPDWALEPPLECVGTPQCGYVSLTVDTCSGGAATTANCISVPAERRAFFSPSATISLSTSALPTPLGLHRFQVELRDSDGTVPTTPSGQEFAEEVIVDLEPNCEPVTDGGAPDAGVADASPIDAAVPDAASVSDAAADAARRDGATSSNDAATALRDAGSDASRPRDAGPDGGKDAGR